MQQNKEIEFQVLTGGKIMRKSWMFGKNIACFEEQLSYQTVRRQPIFTACSVSTVIVPVPVRARTTASHCYKNKKFI
jgi:hypothetical protein